MLQASDLTKAHDGAPLFDGLSFVLDDGERAGLVGPNGVGKSTLLRLLAGRRSPRSRRGRAPAPASASAGCRRRRRTRARRSTSCSAPGWARCGTVRGELHALLARLADGRHVARHARALRPRAGALRGARRLGARGVARRGAPRAGHRAPRRRHAAGAAVGRRAGARAAGRHAAGGADGAAARRADQPPRRRRPARGSRSGCAASPGRVVVVSHDRAFLDAVVGCILELEPGGALTRYEGGYSAHRAERERRRAKLALEYEAQEKRRRRLEADIATTRRQAQHTERTVSRAAAPKLKRYAKKVAKKAKSREGRLRRELEGDAAIARARRAPGAASAPA